MDGKSIGGYLTFKIRFAIVNHTKTKPAELSLRGLHRPVLNVWLLAFFQAFFLAFAFAFFLAGSFGRDFPNEPAYNFPRFVRRSPLPIRFFLVLRNPQQRGFDV